MKGLTKEGTSLETQIHNKKVIEQLKNAGLLGAGRSRRHPRPLPQGMQNGMVNRTEGTLGELPGLNPSGDPEADSPKAQTGELAHLESFADHGILPPSKNTLPPGSPLNAKPLRFARGETFEAAVGGAYREESVGYKTTKQEAKGSGRMLASNSKNQLETQEKNVTMMISQLWDAQFRSQVMGGNADQAKRAHQTTNAKRDSIIENPIFAVQLE